MSADATLLTPSLLREWALPRPGGSKRTRGQVLVCGGARSTPGAVMLAGLAALRVGAGVLGLAVADSVADAVAVAVPEASVTGLPRLDRNPDGDRTGDETGDETGEVLRSAAQGCTAVLLGPGLDDPRHAGALVQVLPAALEPGCAVVLDAFALGVLPGSDVSGRLGGPLVLTPNSSEAARLLDLDEDDDALDDTVSVATRIAQRFGATVSYSGSIASAEGTWQVSAGHPGLGTSGSGDVLAGAVTGLLARGAGPEQAACWATYLHAAAGDRLAPQVGRLGFLARELVAELPHVLVQTEA